MSSGLQTGRNLSTFSLSVRGKRTNPAPGKEVKQQRMSGSNGKKEGIRTVEDLIHRMLSVSEDSPVYRRIAVYIEQHYLQVIFMTAENLASALGVSQGSVSKFCIALGYRGYADFLRSLQQIVGREFTAPNRYHYTASSTHHTDDVIEKEIENIRSLKETTQSREYQTLVGDMASAGHLLLLSARMSATLLPYLKYILDKLRDNVDVITPGGEFDLVSFHYDPTRALVLAIGLPRYPKVLVDKMKELKKAGFRIDAITDSRFSPLCEAADHFVLIPTTVASIFDIYSTPIMFLNLLASDLSQKIPGVAERLSKIERYERESGVYTG